MAFEGLGTNDQKSMYYCIHNIFMMELLEWISIVMLLYMNTKPLKNTAIQIIQVVIITFVELSPKLEYLVCAESFWGGVSLFLKRNGSSCQ